MKHWIIGMGAAVAVVGGLMVLQVAGIEWSGFLGKKVEEQRYDILKESQAHRDGLQRNLSQMATQYASADEAGKAVISASVKHQYSQTDTSEYPQYLKDFLAQNGVY